MEMKEVNKLIRIVWEGRQCRFKSLGFAQLSVVNHTVRDQTIKLVYKLHMCLEFVKV